MVASRLTYREQQRIRKRSYAAASRYLEKHGKMKDKVITDFLRIAIGALVLWAAKKFPSC